MGGRAGVVGGSGAVVTAAGPFILTMPDGAKWAFDSLDGEDGVRPYLQRRIDEASTGLLIPVETALGYMELDESGGSVSLPGGDAVVETTTIMDLLRSSQAPWKHDVAYAVAAFNAHRQKLEAADAAWNAERGVAVQEKEGER